MSKNKMSNSKEIPPHYTDASDFAGRSGGETEFPPMGGPLKPRASGENGDDDHKFDEKGGPA